MNKETQVRVGDLFAEKVCDSFEEAIDLDFILPNVYSASKQAAKKLSETFAQVRNYTYLCRPNYMFGFCQILTYYMFGFCHDASIDI